MKRFLDFNLLIRSRKVMTIKQCKSCSKPLYSWKSAAIISSADAIFLSKNKSSGEVPFFLSPHNEAVDVKQLQPLKVLLLLKESQLCSSFSPLVSSASFHPSVVFLNLMSFSLATVFFFFVCFFAS